jgi:predicted transcriptional regulator
MAGNKTPRQMERHLKGVANHYRIAILLLISSEPKISLEAIVQTLKANEKTIGEHTRRLVVAGLINKDHKGNYVEHTLSPYGEKVVKFLKLFQQQ